MILYKYHQKILRIGLDFYILIDSDTGYLLNIKFMNILIKIIIKKLTNLKAVKYLKKGI